MSGTNVAANTSRPIPLHRGETSSLNTGERIELKVEPLPAEFFEENTGNVLQIAATCGYSAAMRKRDETSVSYSLYDGQGRALPGRLHGEPVCGWQLTTNDLVNYLIRNGRVQGIAMTPEAELRGTVSLGDVMTKFNVAPEREDELSQQLQRLQSGLTGTTSICTVNALVAHQDLPLLPCYATLKSDPSRRYFVFESDRTVTLYETVDQNGKALPPENWARTVYRKGTTLPPAQATEMPWLAQLLSPEEGQPLPEQSARLVLRGNRLQALNVPTDVVLYEDDAVCFTTDPGKRGAVYYVRPNERVIRYFLPEGLTQGEVAVRKQVIPAAGSIAALQFEPRGNFLLAQAKEGDDHQLLILDQASLQVSAALHGLSSRSQPACEVDGRGALYYINVERRLRVATTEMGSFNAGALEEVRKRQAARRAREQSELATDQEKIEALELPAVSKRDITRPKTLSYESLLTALQRKIEEKVGPLLTTAATPEDVAVLREQVRRLQEEPRFVKYPEAFAAVQQQIQERELSVKVQKLLNGAAELREELATLKTPAELAQVERQLEGLLHRRRSFAIPDLRLRKSLDEDLRSLEREVQERDLALRPELEKYVAESFEKACGAVAVCQNSMELGRVFETEAVVEFEGLVQSVGDERSRSEWRQKLRGKIGERRSELEAQRDLEEAQRKARLLEVLENSGALLEEARMTVATIGDLQELKGWERCAPVVKRLRTEVLELPDDLRTLELEKLDHLLHERRREIEVRPRFLELADGRQESWEDILPVFHPVERVWQALIKPLEGSHSHGTLMFVDNLGARFVPETPALPLDAAHPEVTQAIRRFSPDAERYFSKLGREIPEFSDKWVVNEWVEGQLRELGRLTRQQLRSRSGILILTGEAGTGKNVLVDMFGHLANREVTTFSCNFQTEKEDLTYLYQYDPKRGTWIADSNFVKMLQVPGSILVLDEVNTLPKGVAKMLNPLLDYRRTLFLSDGRKIKADPAVLILGTMNPQHQNYQAVNQLSLEVSSRARFMQIHFPPEMENGKYTHYEAEILSRYLKEFDGLSSQEFRALWGHVINSEKSSLGSSLANGGRRSELQVIHRIVKAANRIRESYLAALVGDSSEPAEFIFTAREGVQIMEEIADGIEMRQAMKNVIIPKIRDHEERARVRTIVENI